MKCPICNLDMRIAQRASVDINYCPQCRGVWLARGELERILAQVESRSYDESERHDHVDDDYHDGRSAMSHHDDDHDGDNYKRERWSRHGKRRKEGFLSQLFDMFGD